MVSSTSAGLGAEAVKARLPLRAARWAGLFSDRINCCRSIVGLVVMAMGFAAAELALTLTIGCTCPWRGGIS